MSGQPCLGHRGGRWMGAGIIRTTLRRAAGRVITQQGPVPATVGPQYLMQLHAAASEPVNGTGHHRRDEFVRPVPHEQRSGDALAAEDVSGMLSDVLSQAVVDRIRQVIPEGDHDPVLSAQAKHDQAPARIEAKHVRDHCEDGLWRAGAQLDLAC